MDGSESNSAKKNIVWSNSSSDRTVAAINIFTSSISHAMLVPRIDCLGSKIIMLLLA